MRPTFAPRKKQNSFRVGVNTSRIVGLRCAPTQHTYHQHSVRNRFYRLAIEAKTHGSHTSGRGEETEVTGCRKSRDSIPSRNKKRRQAKITWTYNASSLSEVVRQIKLDQVNGFNSGALRAQPGGKVLITDGPYLETKEHTGGFWVVEAADLNEALEWGRKAVVACRAPVEVRPFGSQAQARRKRLKEKQ